jgi:predicted tellurium resistance membrane protein TerC
MDWLTSPEAYIALASLTALEIVLGVDNIIFISILVGRLPRAERNRARLIGLALAMLMRIALLLALTWIMRLTETLFSVYSNDISGRDLILLGGGLFLLAKSVMEIHTSLEGEDEDGAGSPRAAGFYATLAQIAVIDIVFSLDSVITAVGMVNDIPVMVLAIVIAVGIMMFAAKPIGDFIDAHPTLKMLALSFLIMIGVALVAEGLEFHIPKGYLYFAMAFAIGVEILNLRLRGKHAPIKLRKELDESGSDGNSAR